jgi:hypothetical protein
MATNPKMAELRQARTCYDHLAGRLGVALTESMTRAGLLDQTDGGFAITAPGQAWLADHLKVDVAELSKSRRAITRSCLDWTERRPHLAGAAGAAICQAFFYQSWITRGQATRSVIVTRAGQAALTAEFKDLNLPSL